MDAQLEMKLIECLDALAQGESLERILARHPQEAAQLRPLLETAASLPAMRREPSEAAKTQSRRKFMAQADLLRRTAPRKTMGFLPRFATGFIAAAVVAAVLSTGAVAASGLALPGDPLYGLKRTVEDVRLQSAGSPTQREELQREFEQRRVEEANELLDAGREGEVEFSGTIESMQPDAWIVSGLVVQLDVNTQIAGTPQIDRLAEVRGVTGPGGLRATFISIESADESEITPTPEATETPQATQTPEPAKTVAPETTTIPQPTTTPRPTAAQPPTTAPEPVGVEFTGSVNALNAGMWTIDGTSVIVNSSTEIRDTISVGQRVKVKALRLADGRIVATRIELSDDGGGNNSNSDDNQNSNENQNNNDGNSNDDNGNSNSNDNDNGGNSNSNDNDNGGNSNSNDNDNSNNNGS